MLDQTLNRFRIIAQLEGISFLVLLCIAMPIKYGLHNHWPVKIVGWAHGALFITYMLLLIQCTFKYRWPFLKASLGFLAAFVPFGPFIYDKKLLNLVNESSEDAS